MRITSAGFSLIETTIALGLMAGALTSVALLFALATDANVASRSTTYAAVLAEQKLEELRALTYGFGIDGVPQTDTQTDTTTSPPSPHGGTGLGISPAASLTQSLSGYVDHVDAYGLKLGGSAVPPAGAIYTRRWSVEPLPASPATALVIQVAVMRAAVSVTATPAGGVRLAAIRSRKGR